MLTHLPSVCTQHKFSELRPLLGSIDCMSRTFFTHTLFLPFLQGPRLSKPSTVSGSGRSWRIEERVQKRFINPRSSQVLFWYRESCPSIYILGSIGHPLHLRDANSEGPSGSQAACAMKAPTKCLMFMWPCDQRRRLLRLP
jgi:hypothetical protein